MRSRSLSDSTAGALRQGRGGDNVVVTRRLIVVRHASAAAAARGESDHDRALDGTGRRSLSWLAEEVDSLGPVDLILASTATRVRETVGGIVSGTRSDRAISIEWSAALYLAGAETLVAAIREVDPAHQIVVLCGHNPGLHELAVAIDDGQSLDDLAKVFPTAAVAAFDIDGEWDAVGATSGRLVTLTFPSRRR
jgi:phosphohistidine phosphatase